MNERRPGERGDLQSWLDEENLAMGAIPGASLTWPNAIHDNAYDELSAITWDIEYIQPAWLGREN